MKLSPISRMDFIKRLKRVGWEGPESGGKHQFMHRGDRKLPIPNPHKGDIGVSLLRRILREIDVSVEEWINAK